jgi:maleylpyruvate isomerase
MEQQTQMFLSTVERFDDAELDASTLLPGWSRRHVIAHVHFNAEALRRLVSWAATGRENRMYASTEQRAQEIAVGASMSGSRLRHLVRTSAERLATDLDNLDDRARKSMVTTAQGRVIAATEIPWLRTREVAIHAVDLSAGADFAQMPADLVEALLVDTVRVRAARGEGPRLAEWLTGRAAGEPELGPWL